ncbi:hypothetical protein Hanom_Chr03g00275661 [Helianthus anomalus]
MKMRKDLMISTMSLIYQMVFLTRFFLHTLIIGGRGDALKENTCYADYSISRGTS